MHRSSFLRMEWFFDNYVSKIDDKKVKVLDVGSYSVNGSYKSLFKGEKFEYVGLDMEKGPNVDIIPANPYKWREIENDTFDIVISGQAFEHIEFFWITMSEIARVLKQDGILCIVVPNKQREHRYPADCYRYFTDGMAALAKYVKMDILHVHTNCAPNPNAPEWYGKKLIDSMLVAKKTYSGVTQYIDIENYKFEPVDHEKLRSGLFPYKPKLIRPIRKFVIKNIRKLRS